MWDNVRMAKAAVLCVQETGGMVGRVHKLQSDGSY